MLALKEQYAYMLRPEYADAQGYINIPFSSFDSAWWSEAFLRSELENAVGFSVEVYGVTGGTTVTISVPARICRSFSRPTLLKN